VVAVMVACTTLTNEQLVKRAEEKEWRRHTDLINWELCEKLHRGPTIHLGHEHKRWQMTRWYVVKADLTNNNCRSILGAYWAEY